jgi:predicted amidohydrolase
VGLTQVSPTPDAAHNLAQVLDVIAQGAGADLVVLPENCLVNGTNEQMRAGALTEDSAPIAALGRSAAAASATVILGGFKRLTGDGRIRNTALVFDPQGNIAGRYDKVHLFDANVGGTAYRASSVETPGSHPVLLHVAGVQVGLSICYDIRFPELYRTLALAGAEVLVVPAAFTVKTGAAHWEVLNRSRAIENGAFVVSSATVGEQTAFATYGHALAVDPWGAVLTDLGTQAPVCQIIDLDLAAVDQARAALPVLCGRQPQAYAAPVEHIEIKHPAKMR